MKYMNRGKSYWKNPLTISKILKLTKKAKIHYKACMDDDKQNELGDVQITNHNHK